MAGNRYRVFVSSRMEEFKEERLAIRDQLSGVFVPFVYEKDAGARPNNIRKTYTPELQNSDLYVGIFGLGYGEYTEEEYRLARESNIPCLIYEKELAGDEVRDQKLTALLKDITKGVADEKGLTTYRFESKEDLLSRLKEDVGEWLGSARNESSAIVEASKIDTDKKYYCNRTEQFRDFIMNTNSKINFFIIDGEKQQAHLGLVKRFSIAKSGSFKPTITITDSPNLRKLQQTIQIELFTKFNIDLGSVEGGDFSFGNFAHKILKDKYERVFITFSLDEDLWGNKNIAEAIKWFSNEYCARDQLPAGSPEFCFFLNVLYHEGPKSRKKQIQKYLEKFEEYLKLDELENVGPTDFVEWISAQKIETIDRDVQEKIVDHYFQNKSYPMEEAQSRISQLIVDYNNQTEKFQDLIKNQ